MKFTRLLALIGAVSVVAPMVPEMKAAVDADEKAVAEYRLSMPALQKLLAADRAIAKLLEDPANKATVAKLAQSQEKDDDDRSIDEMVREFNKFPPMVNAIRSAGLTPREYLLVSLAYLQAGMMVALKQQGVKELPEGVSLDNVAFLEKNQTQLKAINKELEELRQRINEAQKD